MITEVTELREKLRVFKDRQDAGSRLAKMLQAYKDSDAIVLAIPAGGVPVAGVIAKELNLPMDVAVVSKITLPWNTEAGFGAVAFDGTVRLNEQMLSGLGLTEQEIQQRIELTKTKVQRRFRQMRGDRPMPGMSGRIIFLVDDGVASGFTMSVAVEAVKKQQANEIIIAVPTGHHQTVQFLAEQVSAVYCANVRSGWSFAVADAYQKWSDIDEAQAFELLKHFHLDSNQSDRPQ